MSCCAEQEEEEETERLTTARSEDELAALLRETLRHVLADAAASSGEQHALAAQTRRHGTR